jgi:phosphonate transport system permease protein
MTTITQAAPRVPADDDRLRSDLLRAWPKISIRLMVIILVVALVYSWALEGTDASPGELVDGIPNIADFVRRMFPPEWDTQKQTLQTPEIGLSFGLTIPRVGLEGVTFQMPTILYAIFETLQMAIIGTTLGIILAIPVAVMAARNISPPVVYQATRFIMNINRAIPEIIFALIFVAAVGLGPFGGVLALAIGSIGFKAKVYAEAIEAIDPQQVQAVRATGASRVQTIIYAVMPQAMPLIASYSLLSFESNVRAATILGLVGAGGVGFTLSKYLALFQYQLLTGALIIIVVVVTLIDRISDRIRKRII